MFPAFYKASRFFVQVFQVNSISTIVLQTPRCRLRPFCTHNIFDNDHQTDKPQPHQNSNEDDLEFSTSETEAILHKFNTSAVDELKKVKYISSHSATAIVTHRDAHGQYKSVEELLEVPRIGRKKLPRICQSILSPPEESPKMSDEINLGLSPTDLETVLLTLNNYSSQELTKIKHIGRLFAHMIVGHRRKHGAYEEISDLLQIQGIGAKKLSRICQGILSPPTKSSSLYVHDSETLQSVQDLVTLDIGLKHIAWLHMTRDREVLEWTVHDIDSISPSKWEPHQSFNVIKDVVCQLPTTDLYLLEHQSSFGQSKKDLYHTFVYVRALEAMFLALLNADISNYGNLGAVSVSRNIVGRHFQLMVGTNRSSGQNLVKKMLKQQHGQLKLPDVINELFPNETEPQVGDHHFTIDENLVQVFQNSSHYQREHLTNCLLQAITFFETMG